MKHYLFILSTAIVLMQAIPGASSAQDLTTGLVAYWPFCNCSLSDMTGHGHDGTLTDGPNCVAGIRDQAYEFNGQNSIDVPFDAAFDIPTDSALTLSAWVEPMDALRGYQALVIKGSAIWDYGLYIDRSGAFMFGSNWPNHETFSVTMPQNGAWFHVAGVYRNGNWKLFINGKLESSASDATIGRSTNGISMGKKGDQFTDEFVGVIDEVRLYNRALTDSEVFALYQYVGAGTLILSSSVTNIFQSTCARIDTSIPLGVISCAATSATLDSLWIDGSSAFRIADLRKMPRGLLVSDSITLSYAGTHGPDTGHLHIRYDLGSGAKDTNITIIGTVASPLLAQPARLHREAVAAYIAQLDSLPLEVDINSAVNLDSLWPHVHDIQATYTFDSSVVLFANYFPPAGWSMYSIVNRGNAVDIDIHNVSSTATHPLNLGTALFYPHSTHLATSWVMLPRLSVQVGTQTVSLCVTENEDGHWSVKTLGEQSGVAQPETPPESEGISIYPNPAEDELFIQNPNARLVLITMYDAIGRSVASATVPSLSTEAVGMESLARGSYVVVCHMGDRVITRRVNKVR